MMFAAYGRSRASAGFNEADLFAGSEVGWYSEANPTNMNTTVGNGSAAWDSTAGTIASLTQATGGNQPLLQQDGSAHYASFDGSNDRLFTTTAPFYNAGAASFFAAIRAPIQSFAALMCEGSSASNSPYYYFGARSNDANLALTIRNDALATPYGNNLDIEALDDTDHIVGFTDTGAVLTFYLDGSIVKGPTSYTRAGTLTMNRFCLGAYHRTGLVDHYEGRVYAGLAIDRVLTSGEIGGMTTHWQTLLP